MPPPAGFDERLEALFGDQAEDLPAPAAAEDLLRSIFFEAEWSAHDFEVAEVATRGVRTHRQPLFESEE